ncbi:phytanoyl-CoA dioxygenase family protein [Streptomyces sp. NPDC041068]|uniref:phytanoyl-CoA dioxygenase family protein n=1 Tax=Streptomyces sp. NPDC041068 TaxID=3155130 RepID=UPI0033FF48B4
MSPPFVLHQQSLVQYVIARHCRVTMSDDCVDRHGHTTQPSERRARRSPQSRSSGRSVAVRAGRAPHGASGTGGESTAGPGTRPAGRPHPPAATRAAAAGTPRCLAVWISVDDCDAANGALSVVPGSHIMEVVCPEQTDGQASFTTGLVRPPAGMATVQTVMRPGDALFFHGSLVHGSLPHTTRDRFRRSLIFHYVPQTSVEVAQWYLPSVAPDGSDVRVPAAAGGGPCGEGWRESAH